MAYARLPQDEPRDKSGLETLPDSAHKNIQSFLFYTDIRSLRHVSTSLHSHIPVPPPQHKQSIIKATNAKRGTLEADDLIVSAEDPVFRHELGPNAYESVRPFYRNNEQPHIQLALMERIDVNSLQAELNIRCRIAKVAALRRAKREAVKHFVIAISHLICFTTVITLSSITQNSGNSALQEASRWLSSIIAIPFIFGLLINLAYAIENIKAIRLFTHRPESDFARSSDYIADRSNQNEQSFEVDVSILELEVGRPSRLNSLLTQSASSVESTTAATPLPNPRDASNHPSAITPVFARGAISNRIEDHTAARNPV